MSLPMSADLMRVEHDRVAVALVERSSVASI
jgi:hypothetical protein